LGINDIINYYHGPSDSYFGGVGIDDYNQKQWIAQDNQAKHDVVRAYVRKFINPDNYRDMAVNASIEGTISLGMMAQRLKQELSEGLDPEEAITLKFKIESTYPDNMALLKQKSYDYIEIPGTEKAIAFYMPQLTDLSQDLSLLEVAKVAGYDTILADKPLGYILLTTDPDADRFIVFQVEENSKENRAFLEKAGIAYLYLTDDKLMVSYTPNQSFLMNIDYRKKQLVESGLWDKYDWFIITTTPSAASWDEWAVAQVDKSYMFKKAGTDVWIKRKGVPSLNGPVGFKEIGAFMRKIERQIQLNQLRKERGLPLKDVVIHDIYGDAYNMGKNPGMLFGGEESGGMILGRGEFIPTLDNTKHFISMREKSAGEASVAIMGLATSLANQHKPYLSHYLLDIFDRNNIKWRYDIRSDVTLYNVSAPKHIQEKEKKEGLLMRDRNDTFFSGIALAKREGIVTLEQTRKIFSQAMPQLDFSNLNDVIFVGDGTYLFFSDMFVEVRPSGTDAKNKGYCCGQDRDNARLYSDILANFDPDKARVSLWQEFIPQEYRDIKAVVGDNGLKEKNYIAYLNQDVISPEEFTKRKEEIERSSEETLAKPTSFDAIFDTVFDQGNMDALSREYFKTLYNWYMNPATDRPALVIKTDGNNANFYPSAMLTSEQREELLGAKDYVSIRAEIEQETTQPSYEMHLNSLDAGLGTNVERDRYVKEKFDRDTIGAKGTDLSFEGAITINGKDYLVSVAEVKLLRLIKEVTEGTYKGKIFLEPILSDDSLPSYEQLLKNPYLGDLLEGKIDPLLPRLIAQGDIHGELGKFQENLRRAKIIDGNNNWVGGKAILVQVGDVIDRGPKSRETYLFLAQLQQQARVAGGEVVRLLGNHELMVLQGFFGFTNFDNPSELAERIQQDILDGSVKAAYVFGDRLFVHGGLRSKIRTMIVEEIVKEKSIANDKVAPEQIAEKLNQLLIAAAKKNDFSHTMFDIDKMRGGKAEVAGIFWNDFKYLQNSTGARAVKQIVGHSPEGRKGARGQYTDSLGAINIDAGLSEWFGGNQIFLEIDNNKITIFNRNHKGTWNEKVLGDFIPEKQKVRTYGQVLAELGIDFNMLIAKFYPSLDIETKLPTYKRPASGSHGEWGFKFFRKALDYKPEDHMPVMISFYNGDGTNNSPDRYIVEWMLKHNVPLAMVSTTKTGIDFKGGQIGIEFLPSGTTRVRMLERGSTLDGKKPTEQTKIFEAMGLPGGAGEVGAQYFNTNIVLINYSLLAKLLQDLHTEVFKGDTAKLQSILAPDLIASTKKGPDGKDYIQLEGPIGTALLNLHNYVATSDDPKVKEILERHNVEKMLRIVNVDTQARTRFFTPIKFATDHWLQAYSDYYALDTNAWMLNDTAIGVTPPIFELENPYYNDVTNVYEAFGRAHVTGLESLTIKGTPVKLANATLVGNVEIVNETGAAIDLKQLFKGNEQTAVTLESGEYTKGADGELLLKDAKIVLKVLTLVSLDSFLNEAVVHQLWEGDNWATDMLVNNHAKGVFTNKESAQNFLTAAKTLFASDKPVIKSGARKILEHENIATMVPAF
ncbi:MAG: UTP--glucose-1-phosphate uridylyltransferase, partial [Candidatus Omnitrophica bacterium]|nr:UTP--glucose-1-phosphate uridylyltransferase [Candidatus Omnitrophota bacterium]